MRGSPSCEITVGPSAGWRLAVSGVALAAFAALLAWLAGSPAAAGPRAGIVVVLGSLGIVVAAVSLLRHRPVVLRWDGLGWSAGIGPHDEAGPSTGELGVALDLGSFLLLSFTPPGAGGRWRRRWIPVGRRGHEREWHLFRCAVYSPRPAPGSPAPDPPRA